MSIFKEFKEEIENMFKTATNPQLSEHFSYWEMTITNHFKLLEKNRYKGMNYKSNLITLCQNLLEPIREPYNLPVKINSGFRCPTLNRKIGGSRTSQHKTGEAADFYMPGIQTESVWYGIRQSNLAWGQLIYYPNFNFIHISNPRMNKRNQMIGLSNGRKTKWVG